MSLSPRAVLLTSAAMVAFAANSLLCRLALRDAGIDWWSFTAVRLGSGAVMLWCLLRLRRAGDRRLRGAGTWTGGLWLCAYAVLFSYAYLGLDAGTGALLLFGVVQATMILAGLRAGERPGAREATGFVLATAGVVYLVLPKVSTPALVPALCMAGAGLSWGLYSLHGRGRPDPGRATCGNFWRSVPIVLGALALVGAGEARLHPTSEGVLLAMASGALASGLGYVLWYAALAHLTATRAAVVQLTVPVLAALGGALFLGERVTLDLGIAAVLVLGGVALATSRRRS